MTDDRDALLAAYTKLVKLYPRAFRDRFEESIVQTFSDLNRERRRTSIADTFRFCLWTFGDTGREIVEQQIASMREKNPMKHLLSNLKYPALIGLAAVLPFVLLELTVVFVKRLQFDRRDALDSVVTFGILWIGVAAIVWILRPLFQKSDSSATSGPLARPSTSLLVSTLLILPFIAILGMMMFNIEPAFARSIAPTDPNQPHIIGTLIVFAAMIGVVVAGATARAPIARSVQTGGSFFAYPAHLSLTVIVVALIAAVVLGIAADQFPCWLGMSNCD